MVPAYQGVAAVEITNVELFSEDGRPGPCSISASGCAYETRTVPPKLCRRRTSCARSGVRMRTFCCNFSSATDGCSLDSIDGEARSSL